MISNFVSAAKTDNRTVISITGTVGWDFSATEMLQVLNYYKSEALLLEIFSFGGSAFDALAIYDYISTNGIDAEANIYGFCGSAATVIACAAQSVGIGENSFFFIHNAYNEWTGEEDESSEKVTNRLVEIYAKKTGMDRRRIRRMMREGSENNTLIGASEALEYGFVDRILKEKASIAASIFSRFHHTGPVAGAGISNSKTTEEMSNEKFNLVAWVKNFFGEKATSIENEEQATEFLSTVKPEENPAPVVAEAELAKVREDAEKAVADLKADVETRFDALADQLKELTEAVTAKFTEAAEAAEEVEAEKSKFQESIRALAASIDNLKGIRTGRTESVQASAHAEATGAGETDGKTVRSDGFEWKPNFGKPTSN